MVEILSCSNVQIGQQALDRRLSLFPEPRTEDGSRPGATDRAGMKRARVEGKVPPMIMIHDMSLK